MNNKRIWSWVIISLLGAAIFFVAISYSPSKDIVGNDIDEYGCIGSAGYSWCESKNKCLRQWEEKCELDNEPIKNTENVTENSFTTTNIQEAYSRCEQIDYCGENNNKGFYRVDCGAEVDGPLYYVDTEGAIILTCGGACDGPNGCSRDCGKYRDVCEQYIGAKLHL